MLLEKINQDLKEAMKSQDKERLETIRLIKTALMNEKIKQAVESLKEEDELAVISKEVKQRRDSIAEYEKAGRGDLADKEKVQLAIIETYLPKQLTKEEITAIIAACCKENNFTTMKDMGKVMSTISPKVKGRADMSAVNGLVKEYLNK